MHHTTTRRLLLALAFSAGALITAHAQLPPLPPVVPCYDVKAYAWLWDAPAQTWRLLPRNEARVFHGERKPGKQLTGTLIIDGCHDVPVISGDNVLLAFRKNTDFRTFDGRPEGASEFEVVKLDILPGPRKNQLIRYAQLQRQGQSAATFGDKREPVTVWQSRRADGVFHAVRVDKPLAPGRYALYLPDRAFEFEVKQ